MTEWDDSCMTWDSLTECTSCHPNHYISDSTNLCVECSDGEYFASTLGRWVDCEDSCDFYWAYQDSCFECAVSEFLDLDTMECVTGWDEDTQIAIEDAQLSSIPLCRSFQYYINPDSDSVVELGTKEHPYKNINFALVEILNFQSHSDRNISIYLMEGTTNNIIPGYASFTNITNVEIVPYSSDDSADPEQAIIIGTDRVAIDFTKGTSKNILTSFELKLDEMIYSNTQLNVSEPAIIKVEQHVILVHRCNLYMDNMELSNDYLDIRTNNVWFLPVFLHDKKITIKNIQWNLHGRMLESFDPLNLYMENIVVDYIKGHGGVKTRPICNYTTLKQKS